MNRNDDIERVLEQWFTEGPRHMSDRLFDGTFERIERLPRGRLADLLQRLPTMNLNVRLAAAAALIVVIVGAGLALKGGMPGVGSRSSPTPPAPSASASSRPTARYIAPGFRPFGLGTSGTLSATVPLPGSAQDPTAEIWINSAYVPPSPCDSACWARPSSIYIVSGIRPSADDAWCAAPFSAPQRTPTALAAWIQTFASLEVSPPQAVTIGGLDGVIVDITARTDATKECSEGPIHKIPVLGNGSYVSPTGKLRLILLDRGDGESILIDLQPRTTWADVDGVMPIVYGFEFTR